MTRFELRLRMYRLGGGGGCYKGRVLGAAHPAGKDLRSQGLVTEAEGVSTGTESSRCGRETVVHGLDKFELAQEPSQAPCRQHRSANNSVMPHRAVLCCALLTLCHAVAGWHVCRVV